MPQHAYHQAHRTAQVGRHDQEQPAGVAELRRVRVRHHRQRYSTGWGVQDAEFRHTGHSDAERQCFLQPDEVIGFPDEHQHGAHCDGPGMCEEEDSRL